MDLTQEMLLGEHEELLRKRGLMQCCLMTLIVPVSLDPLLAATNSKEKVKESGCFCFSGP